MLVNTQPAIASSEAEGPAKAVARHREMPLVLWGALLILFGLAIYFGGIALSICRLLLNFREPFRETFKAWNQAVI